MEKEQLISNLEQAALQLDFTSVETLAADALKAYPDETFGYEYLAEALMKRESIPYTAVENCLIKLIQLDAHNKDAILKYAELKKEQGDIEEAIKAYKNIVAQDQAFVPALMALGEYELYVNNFPEQALVYFDAAISNDPLNLDIRSLRAAALKQSGRILDAMMELNAVIKNGYQEQAYALKVEIMNDMQRMADSIPLLEELVKDQPENFTYQYYLGRNHTLIGEWAEALPALSKAVTLVELPDADLLALYAEALLQNEQFDAANEAILKSITNMPEVMSYQVLQLRIKIAAQKYEEALAMADALLRQADDTFQQELQSQKGFILIGMGKTAEATTLFDNMMLQKTGKSYASYGLGYIAFHVEKDLPKAFFYMNNARIMNHADALSFIKKNLSTYLKDTENRILAENEASIAENRSNTLLQSLFNTVWHFEDISSEELKNASDAILDKVKSQLKKRALFFTEKGVMTTGPNEMKTFTYRIHAKHEKNILDIELIPLNGLSPMIVRLNPVSKGFVFLQDAGEYLLFQKQNLEALAPEIKQHLQQLMDKQAMSFMGDAVQPLIKALEN